MINNIIWHIVLFVIDTIRHIILDVNIAMIKRADRSDPGKYSRSPVSLRIYLNENISEVSL